MNANFHDAHDRHWQDGEQLFQAGRWANADHLYGIAAECGLKRLMLAFGMPFNNAQDRPASVADRTHADGIWARYESYRCGHHRGAAFALPSGNPFGNWDISQRYADQSHFDQTRVDPHRKGAEQVKELVKKARLEGLL